MPKPIRDIVIPTSKEPGERVEWSTNYQGAYVIPLKSDSGFHTTVFVDSLSGAQKEYIQKQRWAPLDELEAMGKALEFSEFHITRESDDMHFYYRIDGRRIYKTGKISSERTATQHDNWTAADKEASLFLQNINNDPQQGTVYDPMGTVVYQPQ